MRTKRILSIAFTLAMLLGLLPGMSLTAMAAETTNTITSPATTGTMSITLTIPAVPYREASADGTTHAVTFTEKSCENYTVVTASTTAFENGKWYVVSESVTNNNRINVNGTANLILVDGKTLTANKGINVPEGVTLNIYAQSNDESTMGQLIAGASSTYTAAGIGGSWTIRGGNIAVYGGNITAKGGNSAAGIGGGKSASGGSVTIYGGAVTATGGSNDSDSGAGIGGGDIGYGGSVTIYGGTVTATGGSSDTGCAAGIGGGNGADGGEVKIYGGTVTATGGAYRGVDPGTGIGRSSSYDDNGTLTVATSHVVYSHTAAITTANKASAEAVQGTGAAFADTALNRKQYMLVEPGTLHAHGFTYAASGATITATCSADECPLTDKQTTLTLAAPTLTAYGQSGDDISADATLTGLADFNTATDKTVAATDIQYYKATKSGDTYTKGDSLGTTAPTGAGDFLAEITLSGVKTGPSSTGDVTASVGYTIAPITISSVAVSGIDTPTATEDLDNEATTDTANVTLNSSGAITWDPAAPQDGKAEYAKTYKATVTAKAADNYAFAEAVTATVNGSEATVAKNDDGTLYYAVTTANTAPMDENLYTTSIPTKTDAGT